MELNQTIDQINAGKLVPAPQPAPPTKVVLPHSCSANRRSMGRTGQSGMLNLYVCLVCGDTWEDDSD